MAQQGLVADPLDGGQGPEAVHQVVLHADGYRGLPRSRGGLSRGGGRLLLLERGSKLSSISSERLWEHQKLVLLVLTLEFRHSSSWYCLQLILCHISYSFHYGIFFLRSVGIAGSYGTHTSRRIV